MIVLLLICLLLCYYYWCRRKLYLHISKIPGPFAFPIIGSSYVVTSLNDIVTTYTKLYNKYGSTIKIWMFHIPVVIVTDPKHIQIVSNSPHCLEKENSYRFANDIYGNGLLTSKVKIWKAHRKIINPTFNQAILDSFVPIFVKHSNILVSLLAKEVNKGDFDIQDYLATCSFDFIFETAMDIEINAQIKPSKILHSIRRLAQIIVERTVKVWLHPNVVFKNTALGREFYELLNFCQNYSGDLVKKRHDEFYKEKRNEITFDDGKRKPFLEHLLALGNDFSYEDLRNEVDVFITAGSDTVSTICGYVLVCLGMHQDVQAKAYEELNDIFGESDRDVTIEDLSKLQYLERVIKETMRLYPAGPLFARNVDRDVDLGNFILPKSAALVVSILGVHRNPDIWPEPTKFDPDRFLPEEVAKRHPYSYIPFSAGLRNCIGKRYAIISMKVLLSTVLRTYKIGTKLTPENIRLGLEVVSNIIGGSNISITKR